MKKSVVFLLCLAFAVVIVGIGFGTSKLIGSVTSSLSSSSSSDNDGEVDVPVSNTQTWFAANLPGAEQLIFRDFESSDELEKGGAFAYNGRTSLEASEDMFEDFTLNDGYLEYKCYNDENDTSIIFFPSYDTKDLTVVPDVLADVVVVDFEMSHPQGTPNTWFSVNYVEEPSFLFSNQYYEEFGESGGVGDPVNVYCVNAQNVYSNEYIEAIYTLGEDFTRSLHITVIFYNGWGYNVYINGIYLTSVAHAATFSYIEISGCTVNYTPDLENLTSLDYGTFRMDNLEMVKFGDGSGSYNGALMQLKTDHSLAIGDIIGG